MNTLCRGCQATVPRLWLWELADIQTNQHVSTIMSLYQFHPVTKSLISHGEELNMLGIEKYIKESGTGII